MKNNERERLYIWKHGYVEEAKKFQLIVKDLSKELDVIEHKLKVDFESLELTSDNLEKIANISRVLLEFKDFDKAILPRVELKLQT